MIYAEKKNAIIAKLRYMKYERSQHTQMALKVSVMIIFIMNYTCALIVYVTWKLIRIDVYNSITLFLSTPPYFLGRRSRPNLTILLLSIKKPRAPSIPHTLPSTYLQCTVFYRKVGLVHQKTSRAPKFYHR